MFEEQGEDDRRLPVLHHGWGLLANRQQDLQRPVKIIRKPDNVSVQCLWKHFFLGIFEIWLWKHEINVSCSLRLFWPGVLETRGLLPLTVLCEDQFLRFFKMKHDNHDNICSICSLIFPDSKSILRIPHCCPQVSKIPTRAANGLVPVVNQALLLFNKWFGSVRWKNVSFAIGQEPNRLRLQRFW